MAKVMISLPDELLKQVDEAAQQRKTTRSRLVANALESELARRDPAEVQAALDRSVARFAGKEPFDATAFIRWDRDHGHSSDRR
jgi:predicted transcriptional regulator